jgi:hypothetical protein
MSYGTFGVPELAAGRKNEGMAVLQFLETVYQRARP